MELGVCDIDKKKNYILIFGGGFFDNSNWTRFCLLCFYAWTFAG